MSTQSDKWREFAARQERLNRESRRNAGATGENRSYQGDVDRVQNASDGHWEDADGRYPRNVDASRAQGGASRPQDANGKPMRVLGGARAQNGTGRPRTQNIDQDLMRSADGNRSYYDADHAPDNARAYYDEDEERRQRLIQERQQRAGGERRQLSDTERRQRAGQKRPQREERQQHPNQERPQRTSRENPQFFDADSQQRAGGERRPRPEADRRQRPSRERQRAGGEERRQRAGGESSQRTGEEHRQRPTQERQQRPSRERQQRPGRERPQRTGGERPQRTGGERRQRPEAERRQRPTQERQQRPTQERRQRPGQERPQRAGVERARSADTTRARGVDRDRVRRAEEQRVRNADEYRARQRQRYDSSSYRVPESQRGAHARRPAQEERYTRGPTSYSRYQYDRTRERSARARAQGRPVVMPKQRRSRPRPLAVIIGVVAVVAVVAIAFFVVRAQPITITLNGEDFKLTGTSKTVGAVLEQSGINPLPGDLVSVDGSILEVGQGEPFLATINGKETSDEKTKVSAGNAVEISDGGSIEEPADVVEEPVEFEVEVKGTGAIHLMEGDGVDGVKEVKTGQISGLVSEEVTQEPSNIICYKTNPDVGSDKVIALTFDDGPWDDYTNEIVDILSQYNAKATFFTVGNCIVGDRVKDVQNAAAKGNQISTHSYDHAAGSGQSTNLGFMTASEQVEEVEKGFEAVEDVLGTDITRVMRVPGGNLGDNVIANIHSLITADIGWNIDTEDWTKPGTNAIVEQIESAWPGAIVLMHDGGGDRSQTVEALAEALPDLKAQGYKFITIDELMEYDLSEDDDSEDDS